MRLKRQQKQRQIFVEYRDNVGPLAPLEERTYTMTHSDETGDIFVTIELNYAPDQTNKIQDQVYMKWLPIEDKFFLYGEVIIDNDTITGKSDISYEIFSREMPLALHAIYTADLPLFEAYPTLNDTPVIINFLSTDPKYDKLHCYGEISHYANNYMMQ